MEPIVVALRSPEATTRQQAVAAIKQLTFKNGKASLAVATSGGITPLVDIIKGGGGPRAAEAAAASAGAPVAIGDDVRGGGDAGDAVSSPDIGCGV